MERLDTTASRQGFNCRHGSLFVFSDNWGRHPSSCQHLVRHLLPQYGVTWVNTIGMRRPRRDLVTLKRGAEKLLEWSQPLKLKEYLATSKPAIVRDLPANRVGHNALDLAGTPQEFYTWRVSASPEACLRLRRPHARHWIVRHGTPKLTCSQIS